MKYVADVLTTSRFVAAIVVLLAGLGQEWAFAALAFGFGILTDAFDGPAARRWPYSAEDNQRLVWRRKDPHMWDNAADLVLVTCGIVAVTFGLLSFWQSALICAGVALLSLCFVAALEWSARAGHPKRAERIDVVHGWVFGAELASVLVVLTIMATATWPIWLVVYALLGAGLVWFKWDRVTSRAEVNYAR